MTLRRHLHLVSGSRRHLCPNPPNNPGNSRPCLRHWQASAHRRLEHTEGHNQLYTRLQSGTQKLCSFVQPCTSFCGQRRSVLPNVALRSMQVLMMLVHWPKHGGGGCKLDCREAGDGWAVGKGFKTRSLPTVSLHPGVFLPSPFCLPQTYACSHIHMYIPYTSVHIYLYIHTCINTHMHTYIHTYIHAYIHTSLHTYIHTYIHLYLYTCVHIHTYISISIYISA